jgi:hypothetical protein
MLARLQYRPIVILAASTKVSDAPFADGVPISAALLYRVREFAKVDYA